MAITPTPAPTPANATSTSIAAPAPKLNADFKMFLSLLTAQMKHQDPLDPVDTAQYTQQLVQFSAVEQAVAQTETLKAILARMDALEQKFSAPAPAAAVPGLE